MSALASRIGLRSTYSNKVRQKLKLFSQHGAQSGSVFFFILQARLLEGVGGMREQKSTGEDTPERIIS